MKAIFQLKTLRTSSNRTSNGLPTCSLASWNSKIEFFALTLSTSQVGKKTISTNGVSQALLRTYSAMKNAFEHFFKNRILDSNMRISEISISTPKNLINSITTAFKTQQFTCRTANEFRAIRESNFVKNSCISKIQHAQCCYFKF